MRWVYAWALRLVAWWFRRLCRKGRHEAVVKASWARCARCWVRLDPKEWRDG